MTHLLRLFSLLPAAILPMEASIAQPAPKVISLPGDAVVPDAEVDDQGIVHVAYLSGDDVFYVRSADNGDTFSQPIRVNTEQGFAFGAAFRGPDLTLGKEGRVHIVWYNAGYQKKRPQNEWGVMYARLDRGGERFEKSRNLNKRPSDNFSVAADRFGNVTVIWTADGAFVNHSDDGGATFSPARKLDLDPCECCGTRARYGTDGSLFLLYRDKTDNLRDTNLARLTKGGTKRSNLRISQTPWPIDSCPMTGSFLSGNKERMVAAWETMGQPFFAILSPETGIPRGKERRVAEMGRYPVVNTSTNRTLVAWKDGTTLRWRWFDNDGLPLDTSGAAKTISPHRPAGAVTKTGRFLLFP